MSSWALVGIVVGAIVAIVGLAVVALTARWRPPSATPDAPAGSQMTRRVLVQRGVVALFSGALVGVASSSVAFLWPSITGRRGRLYHLGSEAALRRHLARTGRPYYEPFGQFYVVPYPSRRLGAVRDAYPDPVVVGMEAGLVAFSQKCTHLGCKVPFCDSSKWFECPCHGSRYNGVGEVERGPAPRGLDHYAVTFLDGEVSVDTRVLYRGPVPGTETADERPAGPHCY